MSGMYGAVFIPEVQILQSGATCALPAVRRRCSSGLRLCAQPVAPRGRPGSGAEPAHARAQRSAYGSWQHQPPFRALSARLSALAPFPMAHRSAPVQMLLELQHASRPLLLLQEPAESSDHVSARRRRSVCSPGPISGCSDSMAGMLCCPRPHTCLTQLTQACQSACMQVASASCDG